LGKSLDNQAVWNIELQLLTFPKDVDVRLSPNRVAFRKCDQNHS